MIEDKPNDEIKEILDYLKDEDEYYKKAEEVIVGYGDLIVEKEDINKLLDYITNLQQENKKLKERCDYLQRSCDRKEEQRDDAVMEYMLQDDYKSRVDKAIKLVESYNLGKYNYTIPPIGIIDLLDILKGDGENEER